MPSQQGFRCYDTGDFCQAPYHLQRANGARRPCHYPHPATADRVDWMVTLKEYNESYGNLDPSGLVDSLKEQTSCEQ